MKITWFKMHFTKKSEQIELQVWTADTNKLIKLN